MQPIRESLKRLIAQALDELGPLLIQMAGSLLANWLLAKVSTSSLTDTGSDTGDGVRSPTGSPPVTLPTWITAFWYKIPKDAQKVLMEMEADYLARQARESFGDSDA